MHSPGSWRRRAVHVALVVGLMMSAASCRQVFGREYEYEEDVTLQVTGAATINVNASLAALVALRGLPIDASSRGRFDAAAIRRAVEAQGCAVTRVSSTPWFRDGRRFVQIRLDFLDVRQASACRLLAWSRYEFLEQDGALVYRQTMGQGAGLEPPAGTAWKGREAIGVKLHLPSRILFYNVRDLETGQPGKIERGNILTWEQWLTDRRIGAPLVMELRMETNSILYRTLWLFAGALVTALAVMGGLIYWTIRRPRAAAPRH